ncbi:MAG: tetratricopeptide repeat protein [Bacteroidota bacterium]
MIARLMVLAALCAFLPSLLAAQSPDELVAQGNQLYQQGKIAEARDAYQKVVNSGYVSGELLYNLGNAWYRTGDIPRAILCYERALRLLPADDDLRHNLQLANLMITDRIEPTPRLFIWEHWDAFKNWLSLRGLTIVTYGWFVAVIAGVAVVLLARTHALRKTVALITAGAAFIFLLFLASFFDKVGDVSRADLAIILDRVVTVKNSPDPKSSDAFVIHGGVKVQIIDRFSTWVKIRLADGKVGWMESGAGEII